MKPFSAVFPYFHIKWTIFKLQTTTNLGFFNKFVAV